MIYLSKFKMSQNSDNQLNTINFCNVVFYLKLNIKILYELYK